MATSHAITVHVPGPLRDCCAGARELDSSAENVAGLLAELERRFPALHAGICDETGAIRRHINVFVNADHIRELAGVQTPLRSGDAVTILPAVSGG